MVAVLQAQSQWLQSSFRDLIREQAGRRAEDQLRGLFDVVDQIIHEQEYRGCIFVSAAMEFRSRTTRPISRRPIIGRPSRTSSSRWPKGREPPIPNRSHASCAC